MDREGPTFGLGRAERHRIALFGPSSTGRSSFVSALEEAFVRMTRRDGQALGPCPELVDLAVELAQDHLSEEVLSYLETADYDLFLCLGEHGVRGFDVDLAQALRALGKPCLFAFTPGEGENEAVTGLGRLGEAFEFLVSRGDTPPDAQEVAAAVIHRIELGERKGMAGVLRQALASGRDPSWAISVLFSRWPAANEPDWNAVLAADLFPDEQRVGWLDPRSFDGYAQDREDALLGRLV